jgi:hypothetical protein
MFGIGFVKIAVLALAVVGVWYLLSRARRGRGQSGEGEVKRSTEAIAAESTVRCDRCGVYRVKRSATACDVQACPFSREA